MQTIDIFKIQKGIDNLKSMTTGSKKLVNSEELQFQFSNTDINFSEVEYTNAEFQHFLRCINFTENYSEYHESFVKAYKDIFELRGMQGDYKQKVYSKYFEQYIATKIMKTTKLNGVMDIACDRCPFVAYASSKFNANKCYAQDLTNAPTKVPYLANNQSVKIIQSNASQIPLGDSSLDFICLLNSWEHFQAPYDLQVLIESSRLLRKGGKLLITPLHLGTIPFVMTDPTVWNTKQVVVNGENPQFRVDVPVVLTNNNQTYAQCHSPALLNSFVNFIPELSWEVQRITIASIDNPLMIKPYLILIGTNN